MLPLLLAVAASLVPQVQAKDLRVPGVAVVVHVPEPEEEGIEQPWGWTVNDASMDIRLSMRNTPAFTDVAFSALPWQPDLDGVADEVVEALLPTSDEDLVITPGEVQRVEHPVLGPQLVVEATVHDNWMERDLWTRSILFPIESSALVVTATSSESAERAQLVLDDVLNMLEVVDPALPPEELRMGTVVADAGYTVELPKGWRALTEDEARRLSSERIGGQGPFSGKLAHMVVIDTQQLASTVFECTADTTGTLEILSPKKSQQALDNFKVFARVKLKGGRYMLVNGTDETYIDVLPEVPFEPKEEGEVEFISIGDREAYLWHLDGEVFTEPAKAAVFYTAYEDVGLLCAAVADPTDAAVLGTFDQVVRGLKINDGQQYIMPLSLRARYVRWWPYSHPLAQLYLLPLPLFLLAGWLVVRD